MGQQDIVWSARENLVDDKEDLLLALLSVHNLLIAVLADLELTRRDERMANAVKLFFDLHLAKDGGYSYRARRRQGTALRGHLCTTGNMTRSLIRFAYLDDERVQTTISWLVSQQLPDGGWDCFGRTMGTLDAWEATSAFAEIPTTVESSEVRHAIEAGAKFFLEHGLLHEGKRHEKWCWLRYPWHFYYDVLVGLDFITALGYGKDPRVRRPL